MLPLFERLTKSLTLGLPSFSSFRYFFANAVYPKKRTATSIKIPITNIALLIIVLFLFN